MFAYGETMAMWHQHDILDAERYRNFALHDIKTTVS